MEIQIDSNILFILAVSFIITFVSVPFVKYLAVRIGAVDVPKDGRRMHNRPIPRMGGLAMFYGFVVSVLVFITLEPQMLGILLGALIIVILGIIDDRNALKAKPKFIVQIIAACIPVLFGLTIRHITLPFGIGEFDIASPYAEVISIIWIVGITNAVNFIDGLDGLAAGVSSIASLSMLFIALIMGVDEPAVLSAALLSAALVGCCVGFLPFNTNPAKIFMGDTGATFLGFILAAISIQGAFKSYALISFVLPFLVLALPIFDTAFAIIRRLLKHKSIMSSDRGHLHHRLIDMGFNQKQAVAILYSISSLLGLSAVVIAARGVEKGVFLVIAVLPLVIAAIVFAMRKEHEKEDTEEKQEQTESDKPSERE